MIKNGSKDGKTISHHILSPRREASKDSFGKAIMEPAKIITDIDRTIVFNFE
jgi:hypothetical protein